MITKSETALEYLQKMHEHFRQTREYISPDGSIDNLCWRIADELAFRLYYQENKSPAIYTIFDKGKPFTPLLLPNIEFLGHEFCECDGFVYDPLNPEPAHLEEYSKIIFDKEIPIKLRIPVWRIPIHLRRGRY